MTKFDLAGTLWVSPSFVGGFPKLMSSLIEYIFGTYFDRTRSGFEIRDDVDRSQLRTIGRIFALAAPARESAITLKAYLHASPNTLFDSRDIQSGFRDIFRRLPFENADSFLRSLDLIAIYSA